jgi:hypothetical protein
MGHDPQGSEGKEASLLNKKDDIVKVIKVDDKVTSS